MMVALESILIMLIKLVTLVYEVLIILTTKVLPIIL